MALHYPGGDRSGASTRWSDYGCWHIVVVMPAFSMMVPAVQAPPLQHSPSAQTLPQAPQLLRSVRSSTQTFEQSVPLQAEQAPATQDWLAAQAMPQPPQLKGSPVRSAHWSLHWARFPGQATQAPATQIWLLVQSVPQAPQ